MKKSILLIALMLMCFGIKAIAGNDDACYVKTADKVYFGQDIKMGLTHVKIISADGTVIKINNRDITAYRNHEKLYMLMPVICDKTDTLCMAMMQFVNSKPGYTIFLYCCSGETANDRITIAKKNYFFVYKAGKFYRRINEDQTEALAAFGIKVI